ncbi:MAG: carbamoyl phosphate synthase small subunit [Treponema sp.]|uniref:carbamoyl phosphate synthase small subunit n=1 Tax=Treponema sp. TaxID=166 RepID=UPI0025FB0E11|nr:carbamoyl phosphate synthase small subunit [Treponema sp.]MBQ8679496.1 glutamine-hydrolyzing carbamoyl-phosphate synthase small subunit [Treponema sp.]MBR1639585.1 carbamoyl phosphate synthase small subunit [Treponema sp.]
MKAWLILADGTIFEGSSIGACGSTIGETVFTTGMTGYLETLTDPSYYGQIVTQTFPLIGNYGVIPEDFESKKCWVSGYVVREICENPSNFRALGKLDEYLKAQGIIGICGIDTRALTKKLRQSGVMNGMIVSGKEKCPATDEKLIKSIKEYEISDAVKKVSSFNPADNPSDLPVSETCNEKNLKIILWDFGAKANIQRELEKRGCKVTVLPSSAKAEDILSQKADGLMLSNGPGDPAENTAIISEIKKICDYGKLPVFGICLGHQMLSLARGCKTCKLKFGHRGGNHPVKDTESGRIYITSQNHGYAVENTSLPPYAKMTFFNVNDGTVEGIKYTDIPAFSVQFHPEACGGPHDTNFLFDAFLDEVKNAIK